MIRTRAGRADMPGPPRRGTEREFVALALYSRDMAADPADVDLAEMSPFEWADYLEQAADAIAAFDAINEFRGDGAQ